MVSNRVRMNADGWQRFSGPPASSDSKILWSTASDTQGRIPTYSIHLD